jgi:hypothetical protein
MMRVQLRTNKNPGISFVNMVDFEANTFQVFVLNDLGMMQRQIAAISILRPRKPSNNSSRSVTSTLCRLAPVSLHRGRVWCGPASAAVSASLTCRVLTRVLWCFFEDKQPSIDTLGILRLECNGGMGGMGAAVGLQGTPFVIVRKACDDRIQASSAGRRVGCELKSSTCVAASLFVATVSVARCSRG